MGVSLFEGTQCVAVLMGNQKENYFGGVLYKKTSPELALGPSLERLGFSSTQNLGCGDAFPGPRL